MSGWLTGWLSLSADFKSKEQQVREKKKDDGEEEEEEKEEGIILTLKQTHQRVLGICHPAYKVLHTRNRLSG